MNTTKFVGFAVAVVALLSPIASFAATDVCGASPLPACSGNGNPLVITQFWGLNGSETPLVPNGATITDEHGFSVKCDLGPCSDLTHTEWYRNDMRKLARSILTSGQANRFPMFLGWINEVR